MLERQEFLEDDAATKAVAPTEGTAAKAGIGGFDHCNIDHGNSLLR